jgi:hypothetical protein
MGSIPDFCQVNTTDLKDIFLNNNILSGKMPSCVPSSVSKFITSRLIFFNVKPSFEIRFTQHVPFLLLEAVLLLNENNLSGEVPQSLCDLRNEKLKSLWVDCKTSSEMTIQNSCPLDCCTFCTEGKEFDGAQ